MVRQVSPERWGYCATFAWFSRHGEPRPHRTVTVEADDSITVECPPYTARLVPPDRAEILHTDGRCAQFPLAVLPAIGRVSEDRQISLCDAALEVCK